MEAELQKAVDSGKLSSHAADALRQLQPGTYCVHKSWGFGQVESVDFLLNQITIHFQSKRDHTMQLDYAAQSLQAIPPDHILALKASDLEGVRKMAADEPVQLVRRLLQSFGGRATTDQIAQTLSGDVFNAAEFKKWWDSTKKVLKKDGHFAVPAKKSEPITLRDAPVSRADELLEAFRNARQLKQLVSALDDIAKSADAFAGAFDKLTPVLARAGEEARKNQRLHTPLSFELIVARDEIAKGAGVSVPQGAPELSQMMREEQRQLGRILLDLPVSKHRRILAATPEAFGEEWVRKALDLMLNAGNARVASELAHLLQDQKQHDALRRELEKWIRDHVITSEILYWLCKERKGEFSDLILPGVFNAILTALERDQFSESRRSGKLHDLLLDDRELIADLLRDAEPGVARDSMRRLMMTPVFEELNKRSLLGRMIKVHPELQSMLGGEAAEQQQEALIVSWESLEKKKAEYEDLITKKIPENTKEISIARSYGDLRENFEFKAAKEMQRVLTRRKAEMERELSSARGTNFENPDTTQVSIGTVVTVRDPASGATETYTLLGAWDSRPDVGIISYKAQIGQALLGHPVGESVELPTEHGSRTVAIQSISAYGGKLET